VKTRSKKILGILLLQNNLLVKHDGNNVYTSFKFLSAKL